MIGNIPDPSPLPWQLPASLEEDYDSDTVSLEIAELSSESSSETSPKKRKPKMLSKNSRSVSLKETQHMSLKRDHRLSDDSVFQDNSPPLRPRAEGMGGKSRRDMENKLKKRNTLSSLSRSFGAGTAFEEDEDIPLDISGPEQRTFDWKKRQNRDVRTTRISRNRRPPMKKGHSMPLLSYSSFEVRILFIVLR